MENQTIKELLQFLQLGARLDLKSVALQHILGLTGDESGVKILTENPQLLVSLLSLLDDNNPTISKDSALSLINISASSEKAAETLLTLDIEKNTPPLQKPPENIVKTTLRFIFDSSSVIADPCCMILSNLSRHRHLIEQIVEIIDSHENYTFYNIIEIFTKQKFNQVGCNLHYLGPVLSNLSQSPVVRRQILDKNKCVIQRLLPFTEYEQSLVRRGGIVATLRNCCFDLDNHEWLLSDDVDILPRLLLPLAGNEEFDDDDNDRLPLDLQYLPQDKKREVDPDIRCLLIEAVTQLCSKRHNRESIRNKNTYVILRELHKWEKDRKALLACENLVDILIRTEDEIGEDNLREIRVPEDLQQKFKEADDNYLKDSL